MRSRPAVLAPFVIVPYCGVIHDALTTIYLESSSLFSTNTTNSAHDVRSFRAHPPRPGTMRARRITHVIMSLHPFAVGQLPKVDQAAGSCIFAPN